MVPVVLEKFTPCLMHGTLVGGIFAGVAHVVDLL